MVEPHPLAEIRDEGLRVVAAAEEHRVPLRLTGGVAVSLRCPSAAASPLARAYKDVDLVGLGRARRAAIDLLTALGYEPDEEFNALQGRTRLLFRDRTNGRQLDVILDRLEMSHVLDLKDRLLLEPETLTPADLLLTKLQVVEINERDLKDATALIHDHEALDDRVAQVLASDWGWWRTATENLEKIEAWVATLPGFEEGKKRIGGRLAMLRRRIEDEPKGLRWRARAKVGDRVRWYELPEEVDQ
ncbi:MAG TPA: hypothetical protein VE985_00160 [Gaiellaceae bacterium]|nr:hypothetical protein [Gaiellaceae bacterium]